MCPHPAGGRVRSVSLKRSGERLRLLGFLVAKLPLDEVALKLFLLVAFSLHEGSLEFLFLVGLPLHERALHFFLLLAFPLDRGGGRWRRRLWGRALGGQGAIR